MTYYAWATLAKGELPRDYIAPGSEVTAADLDLTDEEFQELLDIGSVRTTQYPDTGGDPSVSPREFYLREAASAEEAYNAQSFPTSATPVQQAQAEAAMEATGVEPEETVLTEAKKETPVKKEAEAEISSTPAAK